MVNKIDFSTSPLGNRPALLEGSADGKMPVPVGKWVWPGAIAALTVATVWGAEHIEQQVDHASPQILAAAGVDSSGLEFETNYRSVDVRGVLPEDASSSYIETVLATYKGNAGENIRSANVATNATITAPSVIVKKPEVAPKSEAEPPQEVRVRAVANDEALTLSGIVHSEEDADILLNAASQSSQELNVINKLTVSRNPAKDSGSAESINNLAMIIANFDTNIIDAHIDLDGDLLTGNITTANAVATNKVKAYLPTTMVGVITDSVLPDSEVLPELTMTQEVSTSAETSRLLKPSPQQWPESSTNEQSTDWQNIQLPELTLQPSTTWQADDQITLLQQEIDQLKTRIQEQLVFAPASNLLTPSAKSVLDDIITTLHIYPDAMVEVAGHTDSQSSATYNLRLSQQRAEAVVDYIASGGIERGRLMPMGFGESQPIASNNTSAGRAQNRRVEFRAY